MLFYVSDIKNLIWYKRKSKQRMYLTDLPDDVLGKISIMSGFSHFIVDETSGRYSLFGLFQVSKKCYEVWKSHVNPFIHDVVKQLESNIGLYVALWDDNYDLCKTFINYASINDSNVMNIACLKAKLNVIRALAPSFTRSIDYHSFYTSSAQGGHFHVTQSLLKQFNPSFSTSGIILETAAKNKNFKFIRDFMQNYSDLIDPNSFLIIGALIQTMNYSCQFRDIMSLKLIVNHISNNFNFFETYQIEDILSEPLIFAVKARSSKMVKYLLKNGANLDYKPPHDQSAREVAEAMKCRSLLQMFSRL